MASLRMPACSSFFASWSVPRFVRQKTMVGPACRITSARHAHTVFLLDAPERVRRERPRFVVLGEDVALRVALVAADERVDRAVERRGEQQRLAVLGRVVEDLLHDGQEAHVGHAVGFVDDDDLHLVEHDLAALDEVAEPAGAGDEHVDAPAERLDLEAVAGAAEHGGDAQLADPAEPFELSGDLGGELTGGNEDERMRPAGGGAVDAGDDRDAEGEGLARAGRGPAGDVAAGAAVGERELLDRRTARRFRAP